MKEGLGTLVSQSLVLFTVTLIKKDYDLSFQKDRKVWWWCLSRTVSECLRISVSLVKFNK